jgi:hypothetical protein
LKTPSDAIREPCQDFPPTISYHDRKIMEAGISTRRQAEDAASQSDGHRSDTETLPAKPWATGRTLTPAQRERKRALDRQSHRNRRDKVQSRIAELEAVVSALLDERAHRDNAAEAGIEDHAPDTRSDGLNHVSNFTFAPSNPQEFVTSGADIVSIPDALAGTLFTDSINYAPLDHNFTIPEVDARDSRNEVLPAASYSFLPSNAGQLFPQLPVSEGIDSRATAVVPIQPVIERDSTSTTRLCNIELLKATQLTANQVCRDERANQDAIIRAILEGWEAVERRDYVCPLWKTLHRIDDLIFCRSSTMTRLVMLYTIHRMLLVSSHDLLPVIALISNNVSVV